MKLSNLNFNIVDVSIEHVFVDILNRNQSRDFSQKSCLESFKTICIISSDHKLITQLRKECFDRFGDPTFFKFYGKQKAAFCNFSDGRRAICPHWSLQTNVN
jgi:hypothetical protein